MKIKRLGTEIEIKGTGIRGLTAKLVKRDGQTVIYLRSDGYYEIGNIKIDGAKEVFGKKYPVREVYFSNDDFGTVAKIARNMIDADKFFEYFKTI